MTREIKRSPQESPIDDLEFQEPGVLNRRGFLGSVSLAGLGAAVGAGVPLSLNPTGTMIPSALAQRAPA
jgi:sulfite oxidase